MIGSNAFLILAQINYSTSINGTIIKEKIHPEAKSVSENGVYWCTYDIKEVSDEMRKLSNFKFYENENLIFTTNYSPGSDIEISNEGYLVFYDHSFHFNNKLKILFYSKLGNKLFEREYEGANIFDFSSSGKLFGVGSPNGIQIISLIDSTTTNYPKGFQFSISENDNLIAIAYENTIDVYDDGIIKLKINSDLSYTRKLLLSTQNNFIAAIDKKNLKKIKKIKK